MAAGSCGNLHCGFPLVWALAVFGEFQFDLPEILAGEARYSVDLRLYMAVALFVDGLSALQSVMPNILARPAGKMWL